MKLVVPHHPEAHRSGTLAACYHDGVMMLRWTFAALALLGTVLVGAAHRSRRPFVGARTTDVSRWARALERRKNALAEPGRSSPGIRDLLLRYADQMERNLGSQVYPCYTFITLDLEALPCFVMRVTHR
jgi:hypothetical protein